MAEKPTFKPASFPKLSLRGGPHGKAIQPEINGVPIERNTRLTLIIDPRDAVRAIWEQIVEIDVDVDLLHEGRETPASHVRVYEKRHGAVFNPGMLIAEAIADTSWQALADCARQLELQAKRDDAMVSTGVAPGGTIGGSSGRPPGH